MGRDDPRASNPRPSQGQQDQARAMTDEQRRAARRELWTQAAAAAGYGIQHPGSGSQRDGAA